MRKKSDGFVEPSISNGECVFFDKTLVVIV